MYLGEIETGNIVYVEATFIATRIAPTAQSSAVTFTVVAPDDGDEETDPETETSSPHADIAGPTVTTLGDGRKQSVWVLTLVAPELPGRYIIRSRSTAGIVASQIDAFDVLAYVPLSAP